MCSQYLLKRTLKNCWRSKWPNNFYPRLAERRTKSAMTLQPWGPGSLFYHTCLLGFLSQSRSPPSTPNQVSLRATSAAGSEGIFTVLLQKQQPSFPLSPSCYLSLIKIRASFTCGCQGHCPVHTSTRTPPNSAACLGCYRTQILPDSWLWLIFCLYTIHNDNRAPYLKQSISLSSN